MSFYYLKFLSIFLMLIVSAYSLPTKPEIQGCSLLGIDLQHCLNPDTKTPISINACCTTLNEAARAGYNCLCSLLDSAKYSPWTTAIAFSFANCYISVPPLTHCHEPGTEIAAPVLNHPPPSPVLPVIPISPNVPLPPKLGGEVALSSTCGDSSSVAEKTPTLDTRSGPTLSIPEHLGYVRSDVAKAKNLLSPLIFLMLVVYAYNA